jgi:hypothetical protein
MRSAESGQSLRDIFRNFWPLITHDPTLAAVADQTMSLGPGYRPAGSGRAGWRA